MNTITGSIVYPPSVGTYYSFRFRHYGRYVANYLKLQIELTTQYYRN